MPTKTRRRLGLCESRHVRFVGNGRYQARIPIGNFWGSVNLGLYLSEERAAVAADTVYRMIEADHTVDPLTLWKATRRAIARGNVREDVLPKYVVLKDGKYHARLERSGRRKLSGAYKNPVQACIAAIDHRIQELNKARSADLAASS